MIKVINYRVGNLQNLVNGIAKAGYRAELADSPEQLEGAEKIILPGVGAFGHAMENLVSFGFSDYLLNLSSSVKVFGVCVGMQLLFSKSSEHGEHKGLGLIPGAVERFETKLKVPHIGWNQVAQSKDCPLFQNIPAESWFYFVHSYICRPQDAADTAGTTDYDGAFSSVVMRGNIFGAQFHPEKSDAVGIRMLANFCAL